MSYFTEQIYGFCQEYGNMELPRKLEEIASDLFADSMGCMKAGLYESSARSITKYLSAKKGLDFEEPERLLEKLDAEEKALFYGFVSHNFDFDKLFKQSSDTIRRCSFRRLLALSGETAVSGRDFIRAYLLGTEVSFKVASFMIPGMNFRGFHITPVFGVIGAAAACAWLLKLGEAEFVNAVSIAVSQCSGLMAQFGSMMKFCHCGLAASGALRGSQNGARGRNGQAGRARGQKRLLPGLLPARACDGHEPRKTVEHAAGKLPHQGLSLLQRLALRDIRDAELSARDGDRPARDKIGEGPRPPSTRPTTSSTAVRATRPRRNSR